MDLVLFLAFIAVALILAIIGYVRVPILLLASGILLLLLSVLGASQGVTNKVIANETTDYFYGNQTNQLQILNEVEFIPSFPGVFTTDYNPLVAGSISCYYTLNNSGINGSVISYTLGTINITG